ncbi:hypothetical protein D7D25_12900 [Proteiniphilum sp. X52]|nr:hypothetical protein D7D25_12900 [Proteiniphilum sp. X52]
MDFYVYIRLILNFLQIYSVELTLKIELCYFFGFFLYCKFFFYLKFANRIRELYIASSIIFFTFLYF